MALKSTSSDLEVSGKVNWISLLYCLLIIPDDKQSVLMLSELLSYLHESAPEEMLLRPNRPQTCISAGSLDPATTSLMHASPLILGKLILYHCRCSGPSCSISRVVNARINREGIRLKYDSDVDIEDDDTYENICSLR